MVLAGCSFKNAAKASANTAAAAAAIQIRTIIGCYTRRAEKSAADYANYADSIRVIRNPRLISPACLISNTDACRN